MTALICCVALAVAAGPGANAVSIPHANATHLTNRASMQAITLSPPPLPPLPLPDTFVLLTANYSNHCGALFTGGPRGSASLPEGKAIKWIIYFHTAEETEKALIAHCKWSLRATDHRSHLWNKADDVFSSRSPEVEMCRSEHKTLQRYTICRFEYSWSSSYPGLTVSGNHDWFILFLIWTDSTVRGQVLCSKLSIWIHLKSVWESELN